MVSAVNSLGVRRAGRTQKTDELRIHPDNDVLMGTL
jgi:hypothetical protein